MSRDEEAFNDRANFLRGKQWRGGKQAARKPGAAPRATGGVDSPIGSLDVSIGGTVGWLPC